jgi:hypothetical protein
MTLTIQNRDFANHLKMAWKFASKIEFVFYNMIFVEYL